MLGRELLTPDEVRLLDNRYAILFIRGERPILDLKYDILKHPNVKYTTDGKEKAYIHNGTSNEIATILFEDNIAGYNDLTIEEIEDNYEIITSEEIDDYLKELEGSN